MPFCTYNKRKFIIFAVLVYILINIFLITLWKILQNTENMIWISRFVNPEIGFLSMLILFSMLFFCVLYVIFVRQIVFTHNTVFYTVMLLVIGIFIFSVALSHGESAHSILFFDRKDTYMDFFNSIQYGMEPYKYATIYPPLISAIYGFIGQFVMLDKITEHAYYIRESQIGQLLIVIYYILVYGFLGIMVFKLKKGKKIEKIFFSIAMFFSLPFLFALERGNSVMMALLAIFVFVMLYKSTDTVFGIKKKYISYISLGIAVGIKISPALFILLLVREKKYIETVKCAVIIIISFLVPFYLTDGNLWILKNNLEYTVSLFQSYQIGSNGELITVGNGAFVNLLNTSAFMSKLLNYNFINYAKLLNNLILIMGILSIIVDKQLDDWAVLSIIVGLMILYPGFSAVYNLVYLVIPLIKFLDHNGTSCKKYVFVLLFIFIFAPIVNFRINAFYAFFNDSYPLRLSTVLESLSVLILVIILELISIKHMIFYYRINKKVIVSIVCVFISLFFYANNIFGKAAVEAFFPQNVELASASQGFLFEEGEYRYNGKTACVNLYKSEDILNHGMVILFSQNDNIKDDSLHKVQIFCNEMLIDSFDVDNKTGGLFYIPSDKFILFNEFDYFCIKIVDEDIAHDNLPLNINYIGAPVLLENVNMNTFIDNNTLGLWRYENQSSIFMGKKSEMLFSRSALEDGLIVKFTADDKFLLKNPQREKIITIYCNGELVKTCNIMSSGTNIIVLQATDICDFLTDVNRISIKSNETYKESDYRNLSDHKEKSISISYIGKCDDVITDKYIYKPHIKSWDNIEDASFFIDGEMCFFINSKNMCENGYELIFEDRLYDTKKLNTQNFSININKKNIYEKKITPKSNVDLQGVAIPNIDMKTSPYINEIKLILKSPGSDNSSEKMKIKYFGKIQTDKDVLNSDVENVYIRSEGLQYDKNKKAFFFSNFCEILFQTKYFDGNNIKVTVDIPSFLYMANNEQSITLNILFGDKLVKSCLISKSGIQEIIISPEEYDKLLDKESQYTKVIFNMDESYNLSKLKLSGKNSNYDVSMYIFSILK